ncbi:MAG: lasso peptide biosynthesis B2 protein [Pseudomonadota bacterium]
MRLRGLDGRRRRLLARAAVLLTVASAAVALLPFMRAVRLGAVPLGRRRSIEIDDCTWAIEAAARRLPWRTVCIEKGIALQRLLRSRGIDAILHYGARHHPDSGKLEAHVWVSVGDKAVIGGEEAAGFVEVAAYP